MIGYTPPDLSLVYRIGFPSSAREVNDAGNVAGIYRDTTVAGDPYHGFLAP
ncbi:MAG TPA: hypothetical protein VHE78_06545 [Gemmatimonadaceae bacterium]|nr:hypothetical protein [Gemmatimonadaceae bacterium]